MNATDWIPDYAARTLIAADFDGTLCDIVASPPDACLSPRMVDVLTRVADCPGLTLAVISGRALRDLRRRVPLDITLAGNHGLEISGPEIQYVHRDAHRLRPELSHACETLRRITSKWPGAWVEDKGLSATLHFREVESHRVQELNAAVMRSAGLISPHIACFGGKCSLDLRPAVAWDKGTALRLILENMGPFDWCICLGDDRTDETMFEANAGRPSVRVGGTTAKTAATHNLSHTGEVADLLSMLVDHCASRTPIRPATMKFAAGSQGIG